MNILIISSKYVNRQVVSGVDYHRLYAPYLKLSKDYKDINVSITRHPIQVPAEVLKTIDVAVFHNCMIADGRESTYHEQKLYGSVESIDLLKSFGIKVVCDIDDTWDIPPSNENYKSSRTIYYGKSLRTHIVDSIMKSDHVTTSTLPLKEKVELLAKNIQATHIPNGIDSTNPMFSTKKDTSDKFVTFGYGKVASQPEDLELMKPFLKWAYEQPNFRLKFIGYDGSEHHKKVHKILSRKEEVSREQYGIIPRVSPHVYGNYYKDIDVLITPLADIEFNHYKSHLKMIECAFTDTVFLGSNVPPYAEFDGGIKFDNLDELKETAYFLLQGVNKVDYNGLLKEAMLPYDLVEVNRERYSFLNYLVEQV